MLLSFRSYIRGLSVLAVSFALLPTSTPEVHAQAAGDIRVEVSNEGNSDFFLTPVWFGFHNGGFDLFDVGSEASSALEAIAEVGAIDPLNDLFASSPGTPGDIQGVVFGNDVAPPPINPGETGVGFVTPINPANYQFFSYASMVVPTNDTFIGNDDQQAYQVFNAAGDINDASGVFEIAVFASDIYDAGTEVNDAGVNGGAAFAVGRDGAAGTEEESGVITQAADLSVFAGLQTPAGTTIGDTSFATGERVATIRISRVAAVPEPSSAFALALGTAGFFLRRRRS
jgi:hypothetical protein